MNSCSICKSTHTALVAYPGPGNPLGFAEIHVCDNCGFGRVNSDITESALAAFYQTGNYWSESNPYIQAHNSLQAEERVRFIRSYLPTMDTPVDVLDVGAGMGDVGLQLLEQRVPARYHFIEPDPKAKAHILQSNRRAIDAETTPDAKFDLIFLNHVLEHTLDPAAFLQAQLQRLRPGGKIYIEVPHRDDRFKQDVFPHTLFFSRKSLESLVRQQGYEAKGLKAFGRQPQPALRKSDLWLTRGFSGAVRWLKVRALAKFFDNLLYAYGRNSEQGIWLATVMTK